MFKLPFQNRVAHRVCSIAHLLWSSAESLRTRLEAWERGADGAARRTLAGYPPILIRFAHWLLRGSNSKMRCRTVVVLLLVLLQHQATLCTNVEHELVEFRPPDSLVTCPGCVLSFFCLVKGWPFWKIDGVYVNVGVVNSYEMNGFTFNEKLNKTSGIYNMTMTVEATLDNNDTYIQCSAGPNVESPNVTIIVAGPPLSPSLVLDELNATTLQLSWQEPFTWDQYEIQDYTITVKNSSGHLIGLYNINTTTDTNVFHFSSNGSITETCMELQFNVTASNALGKSKPTSVHGGFPIGPGSFLSPLKTDVVFLHDGTPRVEITFIPPQLCGFQSANYSVLLELQEGGEDPIKKGPLPYDTSRGGPVELDIQYGLKMDRLYLATATVETFAGSGNSTAYFNTSFSFSPTLNPALTDEVKDTSFSFSPTLNPALTDEVKVTSNGDKELMIVIIAAATSGFVCLTLLLGIVISITYLCRKRQNNKTVRNGGKRMVTNPLYEGPIYETITDPKQFRSTPNKPRAQESVYLEIPPAIPPPKKMATGKPAERDGGKDENVKLSSPVHETPVTSCSPSAEDPYMVMDPATPCAPIPHPLHCTTNTNTVNVEFLPDEKNRYVIGD